MAPCAPADIAVLHQETGRFSFRDSFDVERVGDRRLVNMLMVCGGEVLYQAD